MAKNHNHFGGIDDYMKEFSRICVSLNNSNLIRNLESMLNSEVSVHTTKSNDSFLNNYKNLTREIDPQLLSQPKF